MQILLFVAAFCFMAFPGCSPQSALPGGDGNGSDFVLPAGWVRYSAPSGFSLGHPYDWKVQEASVAGAYQLTGTANESLIVWPMYLSQAAELSDIDAIAAAVAAKLCPNGNWQINTATNTQGFLMPGSCGQKSAQYGLIWKTGSNFTSLLSFVAQARDSQQLTVLAPKIADILRSVAISGQPSEFASNSDQIRYMEWRDPAENAFGLEVPMGWTTIGGLFRAAPLDLRKNWITTSPNSDIQVQGGDARIPAYMPPISRFDSNYLEGSQYPRLPLAGDPSRISQTNSYRSAQDYIKDYLLESFSLCSNPRLKNVRVRRDIEDAVNQLYSRNQVSFETEFSEAEGSFDCESNSKSMAGYILLGTKLINTGPVANWVVDNLFIYTAIPQEQAKAQSVLSHAIQTFAMNPNWVAMQGRIAKSPSDGVGPTEQQMSEIIKNGYEARSASLDEINRRRSNTTLGLVDVVDRQSGHVLKVESGSNYYWIDNNGQVLGTGSSWKPKVDFRELLLRPSQSVVLMRGP